MSLGFRNENITGGPLDRTVLDQIKVREKILSGKTRTTEQLQYLNSKTAWVKMTSSVNEKGRSTLAKTNILLAGTLSGNESLRKGINTKGKSTSTAYETYSNTGFRPMAGITSLAVETQNIYGTLRQATVEFVCWDVDQLEALDKLFMRPGFSVLIEWGYSMFVNNRGQIVNDVPSLPFPENTTKEALYKQIDKLKVDSNHNYDAMFGFIKNFIFNLRTDGGYDCRVDVISIGEIIESIRVIVDPNTTTVDSTENTRKNESLYKERTAVHKFLTALKNNTIVGDANRTVSLVGIFGLDDPTSTVDQFIVRRMKEEVGPFFDKFLQQVLDSGQAFKPFLVQAKGKATKEEENVTSEFRYISLGNLMVLFNEAFMLKDEKSNKILAINTDIGKSTFLTFPPHISLDPYVCVLPKNKDSTMSSLQYTISELPVITGENTDILNIQVNIDYILSILDSVIEESGEKDRTLQDVLTAILGGIQDSLGNINEFDLHSEEQRDPFTFYIVDRRVVPDSSRLGTLRVTGLSNTVRNFTIGSKLSPNISSIMAIGAQAARTDVGQDVINLQKWNADLEDRIIKQKKVSTVKENDNFLRGVNYLKYSSFIDSSKTEEKNVINYNKGDIDGIKSIHKQLMVDFLEFYTKNPKAKHNPPGIIPITLSLVLDGISSVKIGQAFLINEGILPSKYDGEIGFIITGVNNSVQDNQWTTSIEAMTFVISDKYDVTDAARIQEIGQALANIEEFEKGLGVDRLRQDPAPIINPRKIGALTYDKSPLARQVVSRGATNGFLPENRTSFLTFTGIPQRGDDGGFYLNPRTKVNEYALYPDAAVSLLKWLQELDEKGIPWNISSAYRRDKHNRDIGGSKLSAHTYGGAVDFANLYALVHGSQSALDNFNARVDQPLYRQIAEIGVKYGWYNPWRLSDNNGQDEIWHFEYWGSVNSVKIVDKLESISS